MVRDGKPGFENATLHVPARELEFWLKTPAEARPKGLNQQLFQEAEECLRPYLQRGRVEVFQDDEEVISGFHYAWTYSGPQRRDGPPERA